MNDTLYVLGTIAFFALMLAFTRGAAKLGDTGSSEPNANDNR